MNQLKMRSFPCLLTLFFMFCLEGTKKESVVADQKNNAQELGLAICAGDPAAFDKLETLAVAAYEEFRNSKSRKGFEKIRPAFDILGKEAGKGNDFALKALLRGLRSPSLDGFSTNALGDAAGMGNQKALEVLLEPEKYGTLLSSTVGALARAAESGDTRIVDCLTKVISDKKQRSLHHMATGGICNAMEKGNEKALQVLTSLLDHEDTADDIQRLILTSLGKAKRKSYGNSALPALISLLRKKKELAQTIEVLGVFGPDAAEAAPDLVALLQEADLRDSAVESLVKIGPPALPSLENAMRNGDTPTQQSAKHAISRIQALAAPQKVVTGPEGVLAEVLGTKIYSTELELPQERLSQWKEKLSEEQFNKSLAQYRRAQPEKIRALILLKLFEPYDEKHGLKPTKEEIQEFMEGMAAKGNSDLEGEALKKMPSSNSLYAQLAPSLVLSWKRNKLLFEQYGGRIGVYPQQLTPEPLDAHLAFLKEREQNGDFQIYDVSFREAFWAYFTSEKRTFLSSKEGKSMMNIPYWKQ